MTTQDRDLLGGRGVPEAGGLVPWRRGGARPGGAERGGTHQSTIKAPDAAQDRGLRGPRGGRQSGARRRRADARPVGAEGGGSQEAVVAAQDRDLLGGRGVPEAGGLVR